MQIGEAWNRDGVRLVIARASHIAIDTGDAPARDGRRTPRAQPSANRACSNQRR